MDVVFRRWRRERQAVKLARMLVALDAAAGAEKPAPARRARVFLAA